MTGLSSLGWSNRSRPELQQPARRRGLRCSADRYSGPAPPRPPKRSEEVLGPFFHAFTKSARKLFEEAASRFLVAFRKAAESLKAGDLTAPFPVGAFDLGRLS